MRGFDNDQLLFVLLLAVVISGIIVWRWFFTY